MILHLESYACFPTSSHNYIKLINFAIAKILPVYNVMSTTNFRKLGGRGSNMTLLLSYYKSNVA